MEVGSSKSHYRTWNDHSNTSRRVRSRLPRSSLHSITVLRTWPSTGHTIGRSVRFAADAVASIDSNGAAKHPRGPTDQPESDG